MSKAKEGLINLYKDSINDYDCCVECGCDLTQYEEGTCCWCLERIQKEDRRNG